ncbi:CPBP family intramembrane glutamic endopeptidase [Lacticaseibacillus daqingensis]|uniref:CPBP family intramembrane glutamic endopeptidase n=1 Tax=Lacticaseibacillus daqingensis TaxID=2486014 RepID=UPI000F7A5A32|nr:CPBP family intramembrane glutamic endopeptidase [Lacticaseibacillus daqingensis]
MSIIRRLLKCLAFAAIASCVYLYQVPMLVLIRLYHLTPATGAQADGLLAGSTLAAGLLTAAALLWLYRRRLRRANPLGIQRTKLRAEGVFLVVTMYALVLALNVALARFGTPTNQKEILTLQSAWPWTVFVMAGLLAPVIEETVFRGLFMTLFWTKDTPVNFWASVLTSGLCFGLLHEPHLSVYLLTYAGMGFLLAYTYRRQRDLRYSWALHMMINFLPALVGF